MAIYQKIGNKYTRKYGKSIIELSKDLKVSAAILSKWESCGFDLFEKAKVLNTFRSSGKKLTHLWNNLKFRCGNPKDKKYKYYGGKGIKLKLEKYEKLFLAVELVSVAYWDMTRRADTTACVNTLLTKAVEMIIRKISNL